MRNERITIKSMEDLSRNLQHLPTVAIADISHRITDWMSSGGNLEDGYIRQQFRYAENIINTRRKHK